MTLQLIRGDTDTHLWAESYDRTPSEFTALPGEAARDIAKQLRSSVPVAASSRYINPEAHDAYLRGRYFWFEGQNEEALSYFRKAVQIQPDYALGWVGLSQYYGVIASDTMNPLEALPQAEAFAQKAVDLDNRLAAAHLVLGGSILVNRGDWPRALEENSRAIELDPQYADAYHFRARILAALGRKDEAIAAQKRATALDPFARPWGMAEAYNWVREYDAAIADARMRLKNTQDVLWVLADSYRCKGMEKEAAETLAQQLGARGALPSAAAIRRAYQRGGYRAVVRWQLDQLQNKAKTSYVSPMNLAEFHAQLGDREETISLLEQGFKEHSPNLLWIQCDPAFDFLHPDPRYRAIIQRIGLPAAY
jgi:tetratricopeptide (TPR) repeat protein